MHSPLHCFALEGKLEKKIPATTYGDPNYRIGYLSQCLAEAERALRRAHKELKTRDPSVASHCLSRADLASEALRLNGGGHV